MQKNCKGYQKSLQYFCNYRLFFLLTETGFRIRQNSSLHKYKNNEEFLRSMTMSCPHYPQAYPQGNSKTPLWHGSHKGKSSIFGTGRHNCAKVDLVYRTTIKIAPTPKTRGPVFQEHLSAAYGHLPAKQAHSRIANLMR